ncbi:hypothetical protein [Paenibacillus sp. DMB20]|uniref:hypothetical protein n=1 Tax=Paenibacillus sp. DMB20 TaxID=1642570 RepID=UPI000A89B8E3|nr:hypothetical protein [Paenibacillus sp. DMB20]
MNHNKWSTTSKKAITFSLAFTLAAFPAMSAISAGSALAEPSMATSLSVDHAEANTPIQYQIHARLDEKKMHIQGEETVTYRNTSNDTVNDLVFHTFADANRSKSTQSSLFKRTNEKIQEDNPKLKPEIFLGGIDIQKVTNNGQALSFTNEKQALTVQLKQGIKPGESVTVQVKFEVKLPYGSQRLSYYKDMINGAHWFPVMSVYDESKHQWNKTPYSETFETDYYASSDYEVHINVPDAYQISMPGTVTIQADAEDGRKIVSTVANNTREFVFFRQS